MFAAQKAVFKQKCIDMLLGKCSLSRILIAWCYLLIGFPRYLCQNKRKGIEIIYKAHASGFSESVAAIVTWWARKTMKPEPAPANKFSAICNEFIRDYVGKEQNRVWVEDPGKLLGSRILVVKSAREQEKGVLILDYSYVFPLFMHLFDMESITAKYYLVLEPSWSGFCNLEILVYTTLNSPVFLQTYEPRDAAFIEALATNLITVPIAANWWVDHRIMTPDLSSKKEVDLVMVAAWAGFKRHWSFFECLSRMRKRGRRLSVVLIGYPNEYSKDHIKNLAAYYGILDQIECYEWLSAADVSKQINRAKAFVLWSRREGINRAIIEAMLANVPVVLREGFNYGYKYPYINAATGAYANENNFEAVIDFVMSEFQTFRPRDWIMENMTCQHATAILQEHIKNYCINSGEPWTQDLAVKTTGLNQQCYWDQSQRNQFDQDYNYLQAKIKAK